MIIQSKKDDYSPKCSSSTTQSILIFLTIHEQVTFSMERNENQTHPLNLKNEEQSKDITRQSTSLMVLIIFNREYLLNGIVSSLTDGDLLERLQKSFSQHYYSHKSLFFVLLNYYLGGFLRKAKQIHRDVQNHI